MPFEVNHKVGNYRILKQLGRGGMGEVYLAEHPLIGKSVALKVIHRDLSANKEVVARFVNEARAVSAIGNEHIVEIHDFGQTPDGDHFFIMEYLQGRTVADELQRRQGPLDPEISTHIGAQIAAGLAAAHAQNIVHRDLKPDNIMLVAKLGDPNFVKILDFGLAKMLEADQQLTGVGVVLGTPEYMSPEVAESKGVDARSDVYSFGVLLFQMMTGRLPFEAPSMGEMLVQQVCKTPPVPRSLNSAISPAVEQIILRCLSKRPDDRFQSMLAVHQALLDPDAYLSGTPPVVQSDGGAASPVYPGLKKPVAAKHDTMAIGTPYGFKRSSRGRLVILVAVALLSGGGGAAAAYFQHKPTEGTPTPSASPSVASVPASVPVVKSAILVDAGMPLGLDAALVKEPESAAAPDAAPKPEVAPKSVEKPIRKRRKPKKNRRAKGKKAQKRPSGPRIGDDTMAPNL